jgi:hypothetical protein
MDFQTAALFFMAALIGLLSGIAIIESAEKQSPIELLGAILTLTGAVCSIIMILQGFHLWNTGWSGVALPPETAGRVAARRGGKGGIILFAIQFLPQFLVFFFGIVLWRNRKEIQYSAKCLKLDRFL